jgi:hypothetical protein
VNRTPSVGRVVLTSSITAVLSYPIPGRTYTEADWNDQASGQGQLCCLAVHVLRQPVAALAIYRAHCSRGGAVLAA